MTEGINSPWSLYRGQRGGSFFDFIFILRILFNGDDNKLNFNFSLESFDCFSSSNNNIEPFLCMSSNFLEIKAFIRSFFINKGN